MHTWNWDDLRLILSVAEHKSFAAAGRALHLNHTTVLRRINAFEKLHAFRLFDRLPTGYTMTDAGEELLQTAQIINIAVRELSRKLEGKDLRLEGVLRITTCDTLMASILPRVLGEFSECHPEISLEVTTGNFISDLAQRHADVAIRTGDSPPDTLIGRRIADVRFAVYAARGFSERHGSVDPVHFNRWLAPDLALGQLDIAKWLRASVPVTSIVFKADSLVTLRQAALGGLGIAALPCYLGDSTPGLERVPFEGLNAFKTELWVLTHQDLRHTARVQIFTRFVNEALQRAWPGPATT
jgi:DNA-binding transcriptional LysR family regulator